MSTNHRVACLTISLLFGTLGISVRAKVSVSPRYEASFTQPAGSVADKAARLTKTDVNIRNGELHLAITTEGEPSLSLFHVYLDTDLDASTGYQPPSRKPVGFGADYLIEGSLLYIWAGGDDHATWSWKQMEAVKVSRGPQSEIAASVPLEKLKIETRDKLRVLVETLTQKWEGADTLPRQGVWEVKLVESQSSRGATEPQAATDARVASLKQDGMPTTAKSASLVQATAGLEASNLIVTAVTEAEPSLSLYHVYIDADLEASTGFHPSTAAEGLGGADFLCEGEFLYAWDGGEDRGAWRWRKIAPITVTRSAHGALRVAIPRDRLNLQGKKAIQVLIEMINDKWEGQDVLPRKGAWQVNLP